MVFRIIGGLAITALGFSMCGVSVISTLIIGVLLVIAGIALLAGL